MNKEDRTGYVIITLILLITSVIGYQIYKSIAEREKSYEYAKNGEIGISSNCYLKNGIGYCEKDNMKFSVDNYYEVK